MRAITILAAVAILALCSCDRTPSDTINQSRDATSQARATVAIDADQKIGTARQMIGLGKTAEAEAILDQLNHDPSKLPQETQDKLREAMKELEQAKSSR
jgi:thioredoxin-like negative regulator of GroEL